MRAGVVGTAALSCCLLLLTVFAGHAQSAAAPPLPGFVPPYEIAKIVRELQSSQVVIALIGPQWNAKNRLDSAYDFVRRELKSALDLRQNEGLKVLPVLVDGAVIPAERLPADLIAMRELEYLEITGDGDVGRIVDGTRRLLPPYWVGSHDDIVDPPLVRGAIRLVANAARLTRDRVVGAGGRVL